MIGITTHGSMPNNNKAVCYVTNRSCENGERCGGHVHPRERKAESHMRSPTTTTTTYEDHVPTEAVLVAALRARAARLCMAYSRGLEAYRITVTCSALGGHTARLCRNSWRCRISQLALAHARTRGRGLGIGLGGGWRTVGVSPPPAPHSRCSRACVAACTRHV